MSISHLSISAAAPADTDSLAYVVLVVLSVGSLSAAWLIGAVPPRKVHGPERIPPESPSWPLVAAFLGGMSCYLFAAKLVAVLWARAHPQASPESILESSSGIALLSTIPQFLAWIATLLGDAAVFEVVRQDLGTGLRRLGKGLIGGVVGAVLIVPPLFLASEAMELIYRRVHFQHPSEHPLLRALGEEHDMVARVAIIFGACVIAPLCEELLFRAHLQTLIQRGMRWLLSRGRLAGEGTVFWADWLAILMTSVLFMSMHPGWSQPIIFLLAICLGYAYERTGNLWVSITMHAVFNASMTTIFLLGGGA